MVERRRDAPSAGRLVEVRRVGRSRSSPALPRPALRRARALLAGSVAWTSGSARLSSLLLSVSAKYAREALGTKGPVGPRRLSGHPSGNPFFAFKQGFSRSHSYKRTALRYTSTCHGDEWSSSTRREQHLRLLRLAHVAIPARSRPSQPPGLRGEGHWSGAGGRGRGRRRPVGHRHLTPRPAPCSASPTLWVMLVSAPLMIAMQLICDRTALATGQSLACSLCGGSPHWGAASWPPCWWRCSWPTRSTWQPTSPPWDKACTCCTWGRPPCGRSWPAAP